MSHRKSMQYRKKQNMSMLNTFHSLSFQTELVNECDQLETRGDLETSGIKETDV